MIQEIYIIDDDESSILVFEELFKNDKEFKFISVTSDKIDYALKNIPSIIIINEDAIEVDVLELCKRIRRDEDNSITPIIVVSSETERNHRIEILKESVEYYIKKPVNAQYLYYTIKNLSRLLTINRRISPLTGLPGNVQIHAELKKRISNHEEFSVLYLDLDNFKAYNDVYGFLKGDEIIKFTADIEVANRKGIIEQFPLTSISIGVVEADKDRFSNMLEIGEIGAQVKHAAKSVMGSSYAIDKRKK